MTEDMPLQAAAKIQFPEPYSLAWMEAQAAKARAMDTAPSFKQLQDAIGFRARSEHALSGIEMATMAADYRTRLQNSLATHEEQQGYDQFPC